MIAGHKTIAGEVANGVLESGARRHDGRTRAGGRHAGDEAAGRRTMTREGRRNRMQLPEGHEGWLHPAPANLATTRTTAAHTASATVTAGCGDSVALCRDEACEPGAARGREEERRQRGGGGSQQRGRSSGTIWNEVRRLNRKRRRKVGTRARRGDSQNKSSAVNGRFEPSVRSQRVRRWAVGGGHWWLVDSADATGPGQGSSAEWDVRALRWVGLRARGS